MGRWGAGAACRRRGRPAAGALDTSVPGRYSSLAAAPSPPQAGTSLCTSDRSIMILFLLFFATQEERASNVQCTLCCYMAPYMSDLVLCCDGLGGMCRENSFIFFWPCATTNEESAAVRSGTMLYLSCLLPCMWAHVQWGLCLAPHFDT